MRKTLISAFIILSVLFSTTSCRKDDARDSIINPDDLPVPAANFISTYFSGAAYQLIQKRKYSNTDDFVYNVKLTINFEMNFDRNGNWIDINGNHQTIPFELIPQKINTYTAANFPDTFITGIRKKKSHIETELSNDMILIFDLAGNFIRKDPSNLVLSANS